MTNALIHIGTHKTGTTSFQEWAFANRYELSKLGLGCYEGLFRSSHFELPMLCLRRDRSMPMRAKNPDWCLKQWQRDAEAHICGQAARSQTSLLVSSEALSYIRHADEVERLVELLSPRDISVVAVLREPSSFLRSYRQTLLAMGFEPSAYRESFAYVEDDSWLVDYEGLIDAYRSVLGDDRVLKIDYEAALQEHGSIIPAILDAWGYDPADLPPWEDFHLNAKSAKWRSTLKRLGGAAQRRLGSSGAKAGFRCGRTGRFS